MGAPRWAASPLGRIAVSKDCANLGDFSVFIPETLGSEIKTMLLNTAGGAPLGKKITSALNFPHGTMGVLVSHSTKHLLRQVDTVDSVN